VAKLLLRNNHTPLLHEIHSTAQYHVGRNYIGLGIKSMKETSNGEEIEMVIEQCETVPQREALKK